MTAVIVELPLGPSGEARAKRKALRELIAWIDSDETMARLEQIDLLTLTDADIENAAGVRVIPHRGKVT